MRVYARIAVLAVGLSLVGCGTSPAGRTVSLAPIQPGAASGTQLGGGPGTPSGTQQPGTAVAQPGTAVTQPGTAIDAQPSGTDVEATKPVSKFNRMFIKRFFGYLEGKNPLVKDRLHALETELLSLNRQQLHALKALRYNDVKTMTVDQLRMEAENLINNPDQLIAKLQSYIDRVHGMAAQDITMTAASLPDVFKEIMRALEEPATVAGHEVEEEGMVAKGERGKEERAKEGGKEGAKEGGKKETSKEALKESPKSTPKY